MNRVVAIMGVSAALVAAATAARATPAAADAAASASFDAPAQLVEGAPGTFKIVMVNRGTATWDDAYRLGVVDDFKGDACRFIETTGAEPNRVHLAPGRTVKPGESYAFEFPVKAPKGARPYVLKFRMVHEGDGWFGDTAQKGIVVTAPAPVVERNAEIVRFEAPDKMTPGQKGRFKVAVRNTGTLTWDDGFRLGVVGDAAGDAMRFTEKTGAEPNRFHLPPGRQVAPGQEIEFAFDTIAPAVLKTYRLELQMIQEGVTWFGPTTDRPLEVIAPQRHQASILRIDAPDKVGAGQRFRVRVTVVNIGNETWDNGYRLGVVDDLAGDAARFLEAAKLEPNRIQLPPGVTIAPGMQYEFGAYVVAPQPLRTYVLRFQMIHEGVTWFGTVAEKSCEVVPPSLAPPLSAGASGSIQGPNTFRRGRVRIAGHGVADDDGPFTPIGTTLFWAAWGYKNDRPKLERALDFMARNGFHYFRALGVVGDTKRPDYWDGREIDSKDPEYRATIAGVTDLAYDRYGIRVEWTLIGDGQVTVPTHAEKQLLADWFLEMSKGREHKIMHFETANESWQNGFGGPVGIDELRWMTKYLNDRTDILVSASAPDGYDQTNVAAIYRGGVADMCTFHFDRDIRKADGAWRPVRQPWEFLYYSDCPPVCSNNEPIGPGASVASDDDPTRLVSGAIASYVSGVAFYVFHTVAGIRGLPADRELSDMPGATSFASVAALVPGDLPSWSRKNAHWADSPFRAYAKDGAGREYVDTMWPDLGGNATGAVRAYGAVKGNEIFCYPMGIKGTVMLEPRRPVSIELFDPITGDRIGGGDFAAGQRFEVGGGRTAVIIKGRYR